MTQYEKTKWLIFDKAIEVADLVKKQEEEADKICKVNIYLMRKYGSELLKDFKDSPEGIAQEKIINEIPTCNDDIKEMLFYNAIFDKIANEMNEEMPHPWYCYMGVKHNGT